MSDEPTLTEEEAPLGERLVALRQELFGLYRRYDSKPLIMAAARPAGEHHGVEDLAQIALVLYDFGQTLGERDLAASAISAYAARALPQHRKQGFSDEERCAYIAAVTALEFAQLTLEEAHDYDGEDDDDKWPWLSFPLDYSTSNGREAA